MLQIKKSLLIFYTLTLLCLYQATMPNELMPIEKNNIDKIESILHKMAGIKSGVYSGTFDPPTLAHNHIIRSAIKNLKLDKLYIFINKNGEKNYKCSARQRVEMLEAMLSDIKNSVVIIDQCSDKKYQDYLLLKKCINQPLVSITGYDSYLRRLNIPINCRTNFDAIAIVPRADIDSAKLKIEDKAFILPLDKTIINGVSSTDVRYKLAISDFHDIALHPSVLNYIIKHSLYQHNTDKSKEYEDAYYAYIGRNLTQAPIPPFDPQTSVEAWHENFYKLVILNKLKTVQ